MDNRLYYDPQSGERILDEEFIRRYTISAFVLVRRPPVPVVGASQPGLPSYGALCPGCGSAVQHKGDVCAMCAQKPMYAAPQATRELGAQPAPAYTTPAREIVAQADEVPAGTVIGGASGDGH